MRKPVSIWLRVQAAAAGLMLCMALACKPSSSPAGRGKVAAKTNTVFLDISTTSNQNASVFEQLMPPRGRDPFFPNSHRRDAVPTLAIRRDRPPPASELVLKGVVGAASHRMALINNAILERGEEGSVRVPGGHVKVRCMEIGEDYAVVKVDGEIQPRRLGLDKKGL
jgi:hypothetical protein